MSRRLLLPCLMGALSICAGCLTVLERQEITNETYNEVVPLEVWLDAKIEGNYLEINVTDLKARVTGEREYNATRTLLRGKDGALAYNENEATKVTCSSEDSCSRLMPREGHYWSNAITYSVMTFGLGFVAVGLDWASIPFRVIDGQERWEGTDHLRVRSDKDRLNGFLRDGSVRIALEPGGTEISENLIRIPVNTILKEWARQNSSTIPYSDISGNAKLHWDTDLRKLLLDHALYGDLQNEFPEHADLLDLEVNLEADNLRTSNAPVSLYQLLRMPATAIKPSGQKVFGYRIETKAGRIAVGYKNDGQWINVYLKRSGNILKVMGVEPADGNNPVYAAYAVIRAMSEYPNDSAYDFEGLRAP